MVWDDGENTCGNACPVVDQESGVIWLPMTWNKSEDTEDKIIAGESKQPRRPYLSCSSDEGKTWPVSRLIYEQHSDYSCLTVLPDKSIGIYYGRDKYSKLTFARFTLQWLSRGQDSVRADR